MIDFACKNFQLKEVIKCSLGLSKSDYATFQYLFIKKEFLTTSDIAKKLKLDQSTTQRAVKKLHEQNILIRRQKNLPSGGYVYTYAIVSDKELEERICAIVSRWVKTVKDALKNIKKNI